MKVRAIRTDKKERENSLQRRLIVSTFIILLIGISASLAWIKFHQNLPTPNAVAAVEPPAFKQPETFNGLLALSPADLEQCDIARMNLLCAEAFRQSEPNGTPECWRTIGKRVQSRAVRNQKCPDNS